MSSEAPRWVKHGLVYAPDGRMPWARHSAMTPTPILRDDGTVRVYAGFRDKRGVSRIGYVDIEPAPPFKVVAVCKAPVLDVGRPGCFDDNGVILGDILRFPDRLEMFYIGFQIAEQVKFLSFTGKAVSTDGGEHFERVSEAPVLDRTDTGLYFRAIHSVLIEDGIYRAWCGAGSEWVTIDGRTYPKYSVWYSQSRDGVHFATPDRLCIELAGDEYRIGRPRVYRQGDGYCMYFTKGDLRGNYDVGYAESPDGLAWQRRDELAGIGPSPSGWDSQMLCYPSLINAGGRALMVYNGNGMGRDGFGIAELAVSPDHPLAASSTEGRALAAQGK